jgi:hypothetical protein
MAPKNYQHLSLQDTPNFTQSGILGLKIYHLATLVVMPGPTLLTLLASDLKASAGRDKKREVEAEQEMQINCARKGWISPGANPTTSDFTTTTFCSMQERFFSK